MRIQLFICLISGILWAQAKAPEEQKTTPVEQEKKVSCDERCSKIAHAINTSAKAVVNLYVTQVNDQVFNPFMDDPAFRFFFGGNIPNQPQVIQGSGSGVILRKEGLLVTCAHVVKGAKTIKVRLNDGREFDGQTQYLNADYDLAFVQIKKEQDEELPVAQIADSDDLVITEPIYLVGNAFGIGQSITSGIVSAINRIVDHKVLLQTDAAANPGNSGGGVFLQNGLYVGTPNAIATKTGANHGVGFVIPSNLVKAVLEKLEDKTIDKPLWIGLSMQELTYALAKAMNDFPLKSYQGGIIVKEIEEKSPFKDLLNVQDVVLKVNGKSLSTLCEFHHALFIHRLNQPLKLTIWRQGKGELDICANPIEMPESEKTKSVTLEGNHILNGYTIAQVTDDMLKKEDIDPSFKNKIAIVKKPENKTGVVFGMSIDVGDIIIKVNGKDVQSTQDVLDLLKNGLKNIILQRGASTMTFNFG
ncbi:MAG: hypothetical protein CNLJKLNK_01014 [Holosporales bacterium]